ncbi:MAG: hypothetical protein HUJ31_13465, partial [Pseudomonadales bacterium]|nr:hypothetical protein [Pseudomonadales bacterium]
MKISLIPLFAGLLLMAVQSVAVAQLEDAMPPEFDDELAEKLGADQYGMRRYVMAFLKAGPERSQDAEEAAKIQRAHLDNIRRLGEAGKLILAGPFLDDGDTRGIYVFNVETVEEARALTETDPAIRAGRLVMELHPWYGSAALQMVNEIGERITRERSCVCYNRSMSDCCNDTACEIEKL